MSKQYEIVYTCFHCQGWNKHHQDHPDYPRTARFTVFSEAVQHTVEHPDHYVEADISVKEER